MARDRFLATTGWLAEHLSHPEVRILDCTVYFQPRADGQRGFRLVSGRERWAAGHIPGSVHADLLSELSDTSQSMPFMMPPAARFADMMGRYGVSNESEVVLYDAQFNMWAARVWWMLRVFGFDRARVLDGGWTKWVAEGRAVSSDNRVPSNATFTATPRAGLIATRDEVLAAIQGGQSCIVNALDEAQHRGEVAMYARPGHIAGSVNVPAMGATAIVDLATQEYLPVDEIRRRFESAGASPGERMITYCGGGIAASSAAFAATMAGYKDVAVYDASLSEWAADPSLPMETDAVGP